MLLSKLLKVFIKNKAECCKKTEILYLVLEDKVGKFFSFPQAEMEEEERIFISSLLFSGTNTYRVYLMLKEKQTLTEVCL